MTPRCTCAAAVRDYVGRVVAWDAVTNRCATCGAGYEIVVRIPVTVKKEGK